MEKCKGCPWLKVEEQTNPDQGSYRLVFRCKRIKPSQGNEVFTAEHSETGTFYNVEDQTSPDAQTLKRLMAMHRPKVVQKYIANCHGKKTQR